eukprot:CAMPEP_0201976416 /NCGR_PEP_ID=MMETSP0904-20121228/57176_1 /ASSEMBLY_ACC=CAM_ASM_000553 /TAXON_ID=420261 /ORGANISM="Thalassiosira antarctica, Strain CCMP982" /LENGTH=64 /DNA_ID=CAMNT_0048527499 /DNA_START=730 /DNA_END=924 /DNA_ORIENTATION=-
MTPITADGTATASAGVETPPNLIATNVLGMPMGSRCQVSQPPAGFYRMTTCIYVRRIGYKETTV